MTKIEGGKAADYPPPLGEGIIAVDSTALSSTLSPAGRLGRREVEALPEASVPPPRVPSHTGLPAHCQQPLDVRHIDAAPHLSPAQRDFFDGVNFANLLLFSPALMGAGFREVCTESGLEPAGLDKATLRRLEEDFKARLAQAGACGRRTVDAAEAREMLNESLQKCLQ